MKGLFTYFLVSQVTGSPLLGLLALGALWYGGGAWWFGRLPDVTRMFRDWSRTQTLRRELGMNPHSVDTRAELGGMLAVRRPAEAKALLEEAVRRCPELALPTYFLGVAHLGLGETEAGRAAIERALAMKPELRFGEPHVRMGDDALRRGDTRTALADYKRATVVHSSLAEAWYKAGKAAKRGGDSAAAATLWRETLSATEHAPAFKRRQDRLWRWRAWFSLRQG